MPLILKILLIIALSILQTYWAMGVYATKLLSRCIDCSFKEDLMFYILFLLFVFFVPIQYFLLKLKTSHFWKLILETVFLALLWFWIDKDIFVNRESAWSTYLTVEEWRYTIGHSAVPIGSCVLAYFLMVFGLIRLRFPSKL